MKRKIARKYRKLRRSYDEIEFKRELVALTKE